MFRSPVPRHQAEVAATTWTKVTAAATARKRRRNVVPVWKYRTGHLIHCPQGITMFTTSRRDRQAMVGGGGTRTAPPSYCRGTCDRQPSDPSRRTQPRGSPTRGFCCNELKIPEHRRRYLRKKRFSGWLPRKGKRNNHNPTNKCQEHSRQKHKPKDLHARPSATREFLGVARHPSHVGAGMWQMVPTSCSRMCRWLWGWTAEIEQH